MQTNPKLGFQKGEVAVAIWPQCVATEDIWIWAVCRRRFSGKWWGILGVRRGWEELVGHG